MTRKSDIFTSACGLAVALVLCACTAGCDRAPEKAAPAPVASRSGIAPATVEIPVMRIGRILSFAAEKRASVNSTPSSRS